MAKIEINLLPKELRKKRKGFTFDKNLIIIAASVGMVALLIVGTSIVQSVRIKSIDKKIAAAQKKTLELKKNIELVDALSEVKDKVLQRMSVIEVLDRNRSVWVRVMEDLSRRTPDYVWLSLLREETPPAPAVQDTISDSTASETTDIEPKVKRVTMEGNSHSLNSLASFMIQLMGSPYFKNMDLQYVKRAQLKNYKIFSFQLVGDLHYLPEFESMDADTAVHELSLTKNDEDSQTNLAVGRK
jgi:Tfp pilus assembly protein PilN